MKPIVKLTPADIARFHEKVVRGDGCWIYASRKDSYGYGVFYVYRDGGEVRMKAHRVAYLLATGVDPLGSVVRHGCDNPPCCNPDHLSLGTQADNLRDGRERGRISLTGLDVPRRRRAERRAQLHAQGLKKCTYCKAVKPETSFSICRRNYDGLQSNCKSCALLMNRRYKERNIGKSLAS